MMLTTHLLTGLAIGLPVAIAFPALQRPILIGVLVGSLLPDLDLYYGHRRTFHFPTLGLYGLLFAVIGAVMVPHPIIVGLAFVLIGAVVHARMDMYGGGLELRPWEGSSNRAVYDHLRGEWVAPRRFVRYDGAPEDVALAVGLAIPLLVLFDGPVWWLVVGLLTTSIVYGLIRKPIVDFGVIVLRHAPTALLTILPTRYLEGELADRL